MRAFGYSCNDSENLIELSECTLDCNLEEIDLLIKFLSKFKNEIKSGIIDGLWDNDENVVAHEHFRYQGEECFVDFIIATRINERKEQDRDSSMS